MYIAFLLCTGCENLYQKSGETSEGDDDIHGFSDDSLRCLLSYCILLKSLQTNSDMCFGFYFLSLFTYLIYCTFAVRHGPYQCLTLHWILLGNHLPRVHPLQSGTTTTKAKNPRKVESVLCARKAAIKPVRLKGVEDARKLFT